MTYFALQKIKHPKLRSGNSVSSDVPASYCINTKIAASAKQFNVKPRSNVVSVDV